MPVAPRLGDVGTTADQGIGRYAEAEFALGAGRRSAALTMPVSGGLAHSRLICRPCRGLGNWEPRSYPRLTPWARDRSPLRGSTLAMPVAATRLGDMGTTADQGIGRYAEAEFALGTGRRSAAQTLRCRSPQVSLTRV